VNRPGQLQHRFLVPRSDVPHVNTDRRFARQLSESQSLVNRANLIELLPRAGHQLLLLRLDDLSAKAGRDAVAGI
jgi:hypothetical protein